jgi:CheY-like chemotaxis protein
MLHESFDLLVASRELPDINAIAVLAALRDSDGRNKDIPAILISSNPAPVPKRLGVRAIVRRDPKLVPTLAQHVGEALAQPGRT